MKIIAHWVTSYVVVVVTWGSSFALTAVALTGSSPSTIAFGRIVVGCAALAVLFALPWGPRFERIAPRDAPPMFILGLCTVIGFVSLTLAQQRISSSLAAVLCAATPLLAAGLNSTRGRANRPRTRTLAGLVIGIVGVGVLVGMGTVDGFDVFGMTLALTGAAAFGASTVYASARFGESDLGGTELTFLQLTCAGMLLAAVVVPAGLIEISPTPTALAALLFLGIFGGALANVLYWRVMRLAGPVMASTTFQLVPVVAMAVGCLFLDEAVGVSQMIGAALVIGGLVLVGSANGKRPTVSGSQNTEPTLHPEHVPSEPEQELEPSLEAELIAGSPIGLACSIATAPRKTRLPTRSGR